MRLHQKAILIYGIGALVTIVLGNLFLFQSGYAVLLLLLPVIVANRVADRKLICPHCQKRATVLEGGMTTPWVGSQCRSCGKEY